MPALTNNCITCKTKNCSILRECDTATLKAISAAKLTKSMKKGERLFSEGDPVQGIYFIKEGFVKIELNGKQGRPLILNISGKGSVFGHRANFLHANQASSVTCATDAQFCYVPASLFNTIAEKSPALKKHIINQLLNEIELAERKSLHLAHKTVREKIAEALLVLARVYGYENKRQSFCIDFCRQEIADFTGTTKQQVSKTLNDFEKEELIKCRAKKFSYLDLNSLKLISNPQC